MTVASFVAAQRADFGVPHVVSCRALGVSVSWFYKWRDRPLSARQVRRAAIDVMVAAAFAESGGTYGSPRVLAELRAGGERVAKKTVEASMAAQGLVARPKRRYRGLTRPERRVAPFGDLIRRDFEAAAINQKWCGDLTEIPTGEGPIYLAAVEDLASRRVIGFALGEHHDAELAGAALKMAVTIRGGQVAGVIFHSDRGSEYTSSAYNGLCRRYGINQSMGRVGSALDNACAESLFSTLEFELLSRRHFATKTQARTAVATWIDTFYNSRRRHSHCHMRSPIDHERHLTATPHQAA